jgi:phosphoribosylaminoimidazolecarboxamide formyltransferase/IMP cyclohydrolase
VVYSSQKKLAIKQIHGKKLSYNNYNDIFSALAISKSLPKNIGTVIVKHANPCGVSIKNDQLNSYQSALACDPISAFGGIVACNYKIKKKLAVQLNKIFLEVVVSNGFEKDALKILKKRKNLRLIDANNLSLINTSNFLSNFNSIIVQSPDNKKFAKNDFKIVSKKKPTLNQLNNLIFAFNVCRHVKSNAIVIANNKSTLGIGSGQPSRLDSCEIAIEKMNKFQPDNFSNSVAASDAFFPFLDGFEKLVQAGVSAIIQPYGSIKDKEIIKFANQTGTVLAFSKTRHFRH